MEVLRLDPSHSAQYRVLLLSAYADPSGAFTSTVAEREPLPMTWWRARLSDRPDASERVWGALIEKQLVGVAGLRFEKRERLRHKAWLFGMAVAPALRRQGVARRLLEAVLRDAADRPDVRTLQLTVTDANVAAQGLYESCGFQAFGIEPYAIRTENRYLSKVHMWRWIADEKELS